MQAWEAPTTGTVIGVDVCEVEGVVVAVVSHEVDDELNEEVQEAVAEVASAAAVNRQAKLSPGHAVDASLLPADRVNAYSVAVRRTHMFLHTVACSACLTLRTCCARTDRRAGVEHADADGHDARRCG